MAAPNTGIKQVSAPYTKPSGSGNNPVNVYPTLPAAGHGDGDLIYVASEQTYYSWSASQKQWVPISSSGGRIKIKTIDSLTCGDQVRIIPDPSDPYNKSVVRKLQVDPKVEWSITPTFIGIDGQILQPNDFFNENSGAVVVTDVHTTTDSDIYAVGYHNTGFGFAPLSAATKLQRQLFITPNFEDISGTGTQQVVTTGSPIATALPLGFSFTYFGNAYTTADLDLNGYITFTSGQTSIDSVAWGYFGPNRINVPVTNMITGLFSKYDPTQTISTPNLVTVPFLFNDISGSGTPITFSAGPAGNGQWLPIGGTYPMGMTFNFFSTPFTTIRIGGDGLVTFINTGATNTQEVSPDQNLPTGPGPTSPGPLVIAVLWSGQRPQIAGNVYYQKVTDVNGDYFVVQYSAVQYVFNGTPVTYQLKLFSSTYGIVAKRNHAEAHYQTLPIGPTGPNKYIVGVQDFTQNIGYTVVNQATFNIPPGTGIDITASAPVISGGNGRVFTQTLGTLPNRRFVAQWDNMPTSLGTNSFNNITKWQLKLFETSNRAELHVVTQSLNIGPQIKDLTVGYLDSTGTKGAMIIDTQVAITPYALDILNSDPGGNWMARFNPYGKCVKLVSIDDELSTDLFKTVTLAVGIRRDLSGNVYILKYRRPPVSLATLQNDTRTRQLSVLKYDSSFNLVWIASSGTFIDPQNFATGTSNGYTGIEVGADGNIYVSGYYYDNITFGNTALNTPNQLNFFFAKLNSSGTWVWVNGGGFPSAITPQSTSFTNTSSGMAAVPTFAASMKPDKNNPSNAFFAGGTTNKLKSAFGYGAKRVTPEFTDISSSGTDVPIVVSQKVTTPIGFTFSYHGTPYTSVDVSSTGIIGFDHSQNITSSVSFLLPTNNNNLSLGSGSLFGSIIAGWWGFYDTGLTATPGVVTVPLSFEDISGTGTLIPNSDFVDITDTFPKWSPAIPLGFTSTALGPARTTGSMSSFGKFTVDPTKADLINDFTLYPTGSPSDFPEVYDMYTALTLIDITPPFNTVAVYYQTFDVGGPAERFILQVSGIALIYNPGLTNTYELKIYGPNHATLANKAEVHINVANNVGPIGVVIGSQDDIDPFSASYNSMLAPIAPVAYTLLPPPPVLVGTTKVKSKTIGSVGSRQFIVQWTDVLLLGSGHVPVPITSYNPTDNLVETVPSTFQIILYETSNNFQVNVLKGGTRKDLGSSTPDDISALTTYALNIPVIGFQDSTKTDGMTVYRFGALQSQLSYLFGTTVVPDEFAINGKKLNSTALFNDSFSTPYYGRINLGNGQVDVLKNFEGSAVLNIDDIDNDGTVYVSGQAFNPGGIVIDGDQLYSLPPQYAAQLSDVSFSVAVLIRIRSDCSVMSKGAIYSESFGGEKRVFVNPTTKIVSHGERLVVSRSIGLTSLSTKQPPFFGIGYPTGPYGGVIGETIPNLTFGETFSNGVTTPSLTMLQLYLEGNRYIIICDCAIWCGPCNIETENWGPGGNNLGVGNGADFSATYGPLGFKFICAAFQNANHNPPAPGEIQAYCTAKNTANTPYVACTNDGSQALYALNTAGAIPYCFFIDGSNMKIAHIEIGFDISRWGQILTALNADDFSQLPAAAGGGSTLPLTDIFLTTENGAIEWKMSSGVLSTIPIQNVALPFGSPVTGYTIATDGQRNGYVFCNNAEPTSLSFGSFTIPAVPFNLTSFYIIKVIADEQYTLPSYGIVSGTFAAGSNASVEFNGSVVDSCVNLKPGIFYYSDKNGKIGLERDNHTTFVGTALDTDNLLYTGGVQGGERLV